MFDLEAYEREKAKVETSGRKKPANRQKRLDDTAKSLGWTVSKANGKRVYIRDKVFYSKTQRVIITVDGKDSTLETATYVGGRKVTGAIAPCRGVSAALKKTFPSALSKGQKR